MFSSVSLSSPLLSCSCGLVREISYAIGDSSNGSLGLLVLATPPLGSWESLASGLLAGDNFVGESASASAGDSCSWELELVGDSSSLRGRGWTHCGMSSPGAFHGADSRLLHCR